MNLFGSGFTYSEKSTSAWNLLYCDLTVRNVRYSYSSTLLPDAKPGTTEFKTISLEDADVATTKLLAAVTNINYISQNIRSAIDGVGLQSGNFVDAYSLELSREWMAFGAWFWEPAQVSNIQGLKAVSGSTLQLLPLALYLGTTMMFWCVSCLFLYVF